MSWTHQNANANLWRVRAFTCLQGLDFSRGVFVVFLLAQGLTNTQVGILQSLLFWTIFLAEIPTGIFADYARRKVSIAMGLGLLGIVFILFPYVPNFGGYVLLFALWGLSIAFCSGASSALLYDGLQGAGPQWLNRHLSELGRLKALSILCMAASMAAAGFLYALDPASVFLLTAGSALAALAVLGRVQEGPRHVNGTRPHWGDIFRAVLVFARGSQGRNMLLLMLGLSLLEACHTPMFIFSQSLLQEMGMSPAAMTLVLASSFALSAAGMYYAPRLRWRTLKLPVLLALPVMAVVVLAVYQSRSPAWTAVILIAGNLIPNVLFVYTDHYIQENAESGIRASWGSLQSFVNALAIGFGYMAVGYAADRVGIRSAFLLFLAPLLLALVFIAAHDWRGIVHAAPEAA